MTHSEFLNAAEPEGLHHRRVREDWLLDAFAAFRGWLKDVGMELPEQIHLSVGFGYGAKRESALILGQTFATFKSADGVNHVFISPALDQIHEVLATLLHEAIHVGNDCRDGHKGEYARVARELGFTGTLLGIDTTTELRDRLEILGFELGIFPHSKLEVLAPAPLLVGPDGKEIKTRGTSGPPRQGTRLIKATCGECGYTIRITRKWLDVGNPTCPCGGEIAEA